jgi:[protein-PII] uridylyltransferase
MRINLERILDHANETLATVRADAQPQQQVERFKRFLKIVTGRLKIRHRLGLSGGEIARGMSHMVDIVVCRACQLAASDLSDIGEELSACSLAALGGYGRQELSPFSDIDLLFLHAGRPSRGVKQFVERVLYLLWDMGLTVGHSFRSVSESVAMARGDLHSHTAMAEARHVNGNAQLFRKLTRELNESVFKKRREGEAFIEAMCRELEARYSKFGGAVCAQEPNVKESPGGLRDLHTVLWVGHARFGSKGLDDLHADGHISGAEYSAARRAYDFLLWVRNDAHFSTGRRVDLLTLDIQPLIASHLGYRPKRGLMASELFMRDYYGRAQELHHFCESFLTRVGQGGRRPGSRVKHLTGSIEFKQGKFRLTHKRTLRVESLEGHNYQVKDGKLHARIEPGGFGADPIRLLEIFSMAQDLGVALSDELRLAVRGSLSLVDRRFRASEAAGQALVEMLGRRGRVAGALRMMHETGFLGRFLPEFARITFLVQHDFYHKYTIDEHTLRAIESLDQLAAEVHPKLARFSEVFAEVEDAAPLYLALLLHDIGKGHGSGHVQRGTGIASRVCDRLGLGSEKAEQVVFLVRQHLLMSHLSQRRDLNEKGMIEEFLKTIGSLDRLNMLLLLTYADTNGVAPGIWNDWKATLLWELYARARARLSGEEYVPWDSGRKTLIKQSVHLKLRDQFPPSQVERHFAMMPERYLRACDTDRVVQHLLLINDLGSRALVTDWGNAQERHYTELTVCTRDKVGLFARLAGALTSCGVNILSADLYTREDGIAIDVFKVCEVGAHRPVKLERREALERNLIAVVEGGLDVAAAVETYLARTPQRYRRRKHARARPAVQFDSSVSATSTVIEVRAEDEPGLAYSISSALTALGLNIRFAKIATEKNLALDIFYVTDGAEQKLDPSVTDRVEQTLLEALERSPYAK